MIAWRRVGEGIFRILEPASATRSTVPKITSFVIGASLCALENQAVLDTGCSKRSRIRAGWAKFQNSPRQLDLSWVRREAGEMTVRLHQHVLRRAYFSEGDKRTGLFGVVWAILVSIRREWVAAAQSGSAAPQAGGPGSKLVREARVEEFVHMYISCRVANFKHYFWPRRRRGRASFDRMTDSWGRIDERKTSGFPIWIAAEVTDTVILSLLSKFCEPRRGRRRRREALFSRSRRVAVPGFAIGDGG